MQQLMTMLNTQLMSSKEIAELTSREHDSVLRSVRNIHDSLPADLRSGIVSTTYVDSNGKSQPMFNLDKDSVLCLISGYDITGRMRIIKRWQELEATQAKLLPQTHIQAVEAYLVTLKQVEAQQAQLGMQAERISEDAVLTAKSNTYYPISHLKQWIPTASGKLLSRMSEQLGYEVRTIYSHHTSQTPVQTYHKDVINTVYETDL